MLIRCPNCREGVEAALDDPLSAISCPSCGSSFSLAGDGLETQPHTPSRTVGQFELLEELGQGSFGSVWKARDKELERFVAIKLPRRGELDADEAGRFLREARAAAQLSHPGIVGVHEVGRDEGEVYIVSELVEGATLAEWIKTKPLSIREAVALVADVADAVHHAHFHGVIHRDLKPANILMDGQGRPRVTDFGLARREAGDVTMTADGKILGTPAYMPPEQAKGEGHKVEATADVYSLGVILYELLTGEVPFRGTTRMLVVQILNDEPPSPRRLNGAIPKDLETIALKCLEKAPAKRYASADELAAELRRFLAGEPVQARPIGRIDKLVRWSRRNRAVAALGVVSIGLLLTVAIVSLASAIQINQARNAALKGLEETKRLRTQEQTARAQAEVNLQTARAAVDEMLTQVGDEDLSDVPQMEPVRRALLEKALAFYQALANEGGSSAGMVESIGHAHHRLGDINELLGRHDEAIAEYKQAIQLFESAPNRDDDQMLFATAASRSDMASVWRTTGRTGDARIEFQNAIATWERIIERVGDSATGVAARTNLVTSLTGLSTLLGESGEHSPALKLEEQALSILEDLAASAPDSPDYAAQVHSARMNIAMTLSRMGDRANALEMMRQAINGFETLAPVLAEDRHFRAGWARSNVQYGSLLSDLGRSPESLGPITRALDAFTHLVADFPAVPEYQNLLAGSQHNLALSHYEIGNMIEAERLFQAAIETESALVRRFPQVLLYREYQANHYVMLGAVLCRSGRTDDGMNVNREAIAIYERLLKERESVPEYLDHLAAVLGNQATAHIERQQADLAIPLLERAIVLQKKAFAIVPTDPEHRLHLVEQHLLLAQSQLIRGDHAAVARAAEEVASLNSTSWTEPYDAAILLAQCVLLAAGDVADGYAARAIELLMSAADKAGSERPRLEQQLRDDPQLAPLRDRPGFPSY